MRLYKGVLMTLSLALLLSGCGAGEAKPEQEARRLRETYQNWSGFQAGAEGAADDGDRA